MLCTVFSYNEMIVCDEDTAMNSAHGLTSMAREEHAVERKELQEPVAKSRATTDAVSLHILRSFECIFGR